MRTSLSINPAAAGPRIAPSPLAAPGRGTVGAPRATLQAARPRAPFKDGAVPGRGGPSLDPQPRRNPVFEPGVNLFPIEAESAAPLDPNAEPGIACKVRIRFTRRGRRKLPFYRLIAVDSRRPRDSRPLQWLGWYDPHSKASKIDAEGVKKWVRLGAQPSDTARALLQKLGVLRVRNWYPPPEEPPKRWSRDNPAPGSKRWHEVMRERIARGDPSADPERVRVTTRTGKVRIEPA